ncbi:Hypothetical predicted protein [Octopus vulgaris]|uniref:Uncharacterized protein n=1 Tax=Octopus vulgaris TaxID=6645 RepID=A0AA36EYB4_OCTVU|nr:Hypothetical predicted protein [Octopus vulgaris]
MLWSFVISFMKASLLISAFTTSCVFFSLPLSQIPSTWIAWHFFTQISSSTCVICLNQPQTIPDSSYTQFFSSLICTSSLMQTNSSHPVEHTFFSLCCYTFSTFNTLVSLPCKITLLYNHHTICLLFGLRIPLLSVETIMP